MSTFRGLPRVPDGAPRITLYSRPACHLCEVARALLYSLQRTIPFHLDIVDITADPDLERRYLYEIPVVTLGDEQLCTGSVDLERVRAAVNNARIAAARRAATGEP